MSPAALTQLIADVAGGVSRAAQAEAAADAALGAAQVAAAARDWEAAEAALERALAAAEASGGAAGGGVPPVLLALAGVYARSGRVLFSEGLLREAAKLLAGGVSEPERCVLHSFLRLQPIPAAGGGGGGGRGDGAQEGRVSVMFAAQAHQCATACSDR